MSASPGHVHASPAAEAPQYAQHGPDAGTAVVPPTAPSQTYAVQYDQADIRDKEQRARDAPLQPVDDATDGNMTARHEATPDVRFICTNQIAPYVAEASRPYHVGL